MRGQQVDNKPGERLNSLRLGDGALLARSTADAAERPGRGALRFTLHASGRAGIIAAVTD